MNHNLFVALRGAFPTDLNATAVETDNGLHYSWRDLDRASAMLANWLDSLQLPESSRIAVQVEKSVEAMVLYLATLRAGYVFLPLNTAYTASELAYFLDECFRNVLRPLFVFSSAFLFFNLFFHRVSTELILYLLHLLLKKILPLLL